MKISVVIPAFNAASCIVDVLQALGQQTQPPDQIIVADDGSGDATADLAERREPPCCVCHMVDRQKPAMPALHAATGEIIVFLDSDCTPQPDFLEKLTAATQVRRRRCRQGSLSHPPEILCRALCPTGV